MIHSAMKYNVNVISERKMFRKKDMQYRILLRIFFFTNYAMAKDI